MLPDPQRQHPLGCGIGLVVPVHRTQAGFAIVPVKAKGARKNDRGPGVAPSFCFFAFKPRVNEIWMLFSQFKS